MSEENVSNDDLGEISGLDALTFVAFVQALLDRGWYSLEEACAESDASEDTERDK